MSLPGSASQPTFAPTHEQLERDSEFQLQICSACSGEVLLKSVAVAADWTIRRLKLAIAHAVGTCATDQFLLFAGRVLADNEVLSSVLPQSRELPHTLMLLRSQPQAAVQRPAEASAAHRHLTVISTGELVSCVRWRVEARDLKRKDFSLTSPMFELNFGDGLEKIPFRITLLASDGRSFARSEGQGCIQLKCLSGLSTAEAHTRVLAWVSSGSESTPVAQETAVEQEHCFATNAALRLPRSGCIDFSAFADPQSSTFEVAVEIVHAHEAKGKNELV